MQRNGGLFLGVLLLGLGAIFLLEAVDLWPDDASTWPGILIVIGLAIALDELFKKGRVSWFAPVVLIGVGTYFLLRDFDVVDSDFLVPAILIGVGVVVIVGAFRNRVVETSVINVPRDGAERARVRIEHGGGELRIGALPSGGATLCSGSAGRVEQQVRRSGDRLDVTLRQTPGSWARGLGKEFRVDFNPDVYLELDMRTGATDTRIDLSNLLVNQLELKTGASSTVVTAPQRGHTAASIEAGAAGVEVRIPPQVAARITTDTGLAEVNIDTNRFVPTAGGYESPDYAVAPARLDLRIKGGVASFRVT